MKLGLLVGPLRVQQPSLVSLPVTWTAQDQSRFHPISKQMGRVCVCLCITPNRLFLLTESSPGDSLSSPGLCCASGCLGFARVYCFLLDMSDQKRGTIKKKPDCQISRKKRKSEVSGFLRSVGLSSVPPKDLPVGNLS